WTGGAAKPATAALANAVLVWVRKSRREQAIEVGFVDKGPPPQLGTRDDANVDQVESLCQAKRAASWPTASNWAKILRILPSSASVRRHRSRAIPRASSRRVAMAGSRSSLMPTTLSAAVQTGRTSATVSPS